METLLAHPGAQDPPPLLSVQGLDVEFQTQKGSLKAVRNLSYTIAKGETLGIVGESGCGKSVTSLAVMGLIDAPGRVTKGHIQMGGTNLVGLSEGERQKWRGRRVAMIFQEPMTALNPVWTIGWQILEQLRQHFPQMGKREAQARAVDLLAQVGIPSPQQRAREYPHQLSGGMRQRAMIAMALSCEPELLIADEPTTALDVTIQAQILELIVKLQEKHGTSVQFITHDLGVISETADRVLVMYAGQSCEAASNAELFRNPLHPYTIALLHSRPRLGHLQRRLPAIRGQVPALAQLPIGCPFQNRCQRVKPLCREENPPLREVAPGHSVSCHDV